MKPIRVPALAPEQLAELEELYRTTREARLRTRAQTICVPGSRSTASRRSANCSEWIRGTHDADRCEDRQSE